MTIINNNKRGPSEDTVLYKGMLGGILNEEVTKTLDSLLFLSTEKRVIVLLQLAALSGQNKEFVRHKQLYEVISLNLSLISFYISSSELSRILNAFAKKGIVEKSKRYGFRLTELGYVYLVGFVEFFYQVLSYRIITGPYPSSLKRELLKELEPHTFCEREIIPFIGIWKYLPEPFSSELVKKLKTAHEEAIKYSERSEEETQLREKRVIRFVK